MARSQEGLARAVVRGVCRGSALSLVGSWTGVSARAVLGLGVLEGSRAFISMPGTLLMGSGPVISHS